MTGACGVHSPAPVPRNRTILIGIAEGDWHRMLAMPYPSCFYYPSHARPPGWVSEFIGVVAGRARSNRLDQDHRANQQQGPVTSSTWSHTVGITVELGSGKEKRIRRPVRFGENGKERVAYHVDAVHDALGILVEVEAGRGARGNAVYRKLVRSSLIVDARFLALCSCFNIVT